MEAIEVKVMNYDDGDFWQMAKVFSTQNEKVKPSANEKEKSKELLMKHVETITKIRKTEIVVMKDSGNPTLVIETYMKEKSVNGILLFAMIGGSFSFNLQVKNSDLDYLGVFSYHMEDYFSLGQRKTAYNNHDPDIVLLEVGEFCNRFVKGNPKVVEMIFAKKFFEEKSVFGTLRKLVSERSSLFVTKKVCTGFLKYAWSEVDKMNKDKKRWKKFIYHSFRVLYELEYIFEFGKPQIFFKTNDSSRKFIMEIRNSDETDDTMRKVYTDKLLLKLKETKGKLKSLKIVESLDLKKNPQGYALLNNWLVNVRKTLFLGENKK